MAAVGSTFTFENQNIFSQIYSKVHTCGTGSINPEEAEDEEESLGILLLLPSALKGDTFSFSVDSSASGLKSYHFKTTKFRETPIQHTN